LILSSSCLYPEGGGQISDIGAISSDNCSFKVIDVQKINKTIVHKCILLSGKLNVDDTVITKFDENRRRRMAANHSSTHLLHYYLRTTLGDHVQQRGSSVTDKGFRFDFTHNKPINDKQINEIESLINNEIFISTQTQTKYSQYDNAIKSGALAFFDEKYDDEVRVVNIGQSSIELCGGTHVSNTSEIGVLKIVNQSSVANGVRRIECVTGPSVLEYINKNLNVLDNICNEFQATSENVLNKVNILKDEIKSLKKKNTIYSKDYLSNLSEKFIENKTLNNSTYIVEHFDNLDAGEIKLLSDIIKSRINKCIIFLIVVSKSNTTCYISVSKNIISSYNAKNLSKAINEKFSGKGGGSETFATSILTKITMDKLKGYIKEIL
jgi:alanyl-tRNA synthetase